MKIVYRARAFADLKGIHDYIANDSPNVARSVVERIRESIERLAEFPHSGRIGLRAGTRELVVRRLPYIVVYKPPQSRTSASVEILAIYHKGQNRRAN